MPNGGLVTGTVQRDNKIVIIIDCNFRLVKTAALDKAVSQINLLYNETLEQ